MKIEIRKMVAEDWDSVREIFKEGLETRIATFQDRIPTYEKWNAAYMEECRLVAVADNQIVGYCVLSKVSNRYSYRGVAEISIYVKISCKGNGIGYKLLTSIIEESEKIGIWSLQSTILELNEASRALHKKAGFREIGYREKIAMDHHGVWRNTILMERRSQKVGI